MKKKRERKQRSPKYETRSRKRQIRLFVVICCILLVKLMNDMHKKALSGEYNRRWRKLGWVSWMIHYFTHHESLSVASMVESRDQMIIYLSFFFFITF